jgi:hypothetical protein
MAKSANFKVTVKLEKLEIHVEGDRELVPEIANSVSHQIAEVIQPKGFLEAPTDGQNPVINVPAASASSVRRQRRRTVGKAETPGATTGAIDWSHDAVKWGTPVQDWKQWQKVLWLLSVVENEAGRKNGLTSTEIAETFKQKFRASGLLLKGNIHRDLTKRPDYFGSVDGYWFLKQGGKEEAVKLVAEAKGTKVNAATA